MNAFLHEMAWITILFTVPNLCFVAATADSHIGRVESALQHTIKEIPYKSSSKDQGEWCKMVQF